MFGFGRWALLLIAASTWCASAQNPTRFSKEGRFLYADDDDWDWASPANAKVPCRLSIYGRMPWFALDWMEEGLDEVRGVLVGTPPVSGNYLTMADLNKIRKAGSKRSYEQITHTANVLSNLLADKKPPNLIIMMQDCGPAGMPPITAKDAAAGLEFVRRGGRLIVLDDWQCYQTLVGPFLDKRLFTQKPQKPLPTARLRQDVEDKVRRLGSADFKVREKAKADLLKMGPAIVPILELQRPKSLEEEARLRQILKVLNPMIEIPNGEFWLKKAVQTAKAVHPLCEIKMISRNGNQEPGIALCIRLLPSSINGK